MKKTKILIASVGILLSTCWAETRATTPINGQDLQGDIDVLMQHTYPEIMEQPALRKLWWDTTWKAFPGPNNDYAPDKSDFNKALIFTSAPKPGVHPRVYLRPESLPALRDRVQNDPATKRYFEHYKTNAAFLYTKTGDLFQALLADTSKDKIEQLYAKDLFPMAQYMMWESLRILVDEDRVAGEKLAEAVDHYATFLHQVYEERDVDGKYFYEKIRNLPDYMKEKTLGDKQYQEITSFFQEYSICFTYDFLYPYMTDTERDNVRSLISKLTTDVWIHGMGIADTGGNWGPHHWKGGMAALCIEGEEGFDPDTKAGLLQVMKAYYAGDFTEQGMGYEGLGKGTVASAGLLVAANQGWDLAFSQKGRRAVSRTLINSMLPDRENILALGGLGSTHRRLSEYAHVAVILKYLYPEDAEMDYLMRVYQGEEYVNMKPHNFNLHYGGIHHPLTELISMVTYDRTKTMEEVEAAAFEANPTTFFCPEFSMLSARSSWDTNALWTAFVVRSYNYGHCRRDRGMFTLASHGRQWSIYPYGRGGDDWGNSYAAQNTSVMSIDKRSTLGEEARMIGFENGKQYSFATGDIKHSWDWKGEVPRDQTALSPVTLADMQPLHRNDMPFKQISLSLFPHWLQPGQPSGPDLRSVHFPVQYAYRTVGVVKGAHPYTVVFDDLKKDSKERLYTFHMTTEPDVVLESVKGNEILLGEEGGTRKLKIFVFDSENPDRKFATRLVDMYMGITGTQAARQLQISTPASGVRLKVLLFPYDAAEGDPAIRVSAQGQRLQVNRAGVTDQFNFQVDEAGMSRFEAKIGSEQLSYRVQHTPLPGTGPIPETSNLYKVK